MFNEYRLDVETALQAISAESVYLMVESLRRAKVHNASVYIIGNGGSASTAGHFANDLVKMAGIKAYSLPDMTAPITAYGNDEGWENMYASYLRKVIQPQDVLIAISCSGNSRNIVEAVKMIKEHGTTGLKVLTLVGADYDCALSKLVPNVIVYVPFKDIRVQEDCHLMICHAIVGALRA